MPNETPNVSIRAVIAGVAGFVLITVLMLGLIEWIGLENIQAFIDNAGPFAPLAYILIKMSTYIFAPLSSGPIQLSSGILFGLIPGLLYTMIGEVLGGIINFMIARSLGRQMVRRMVGEEGVTRVDRAVSQLGGWKALVYARVFLAPIYDFISYAAGFTKTITLAQYILVSFFVGLIPTFLFVAAGTSLATDRSMVLVLYAVMGAISLIPIVINWVRRRQTPKADQPAS